MSFADDLNFVAKTPQQVADEKSKAAKKMGEIYAANDYDKIKQEFKDRASSGKYTEVDGKKYIEFELTKGHFTGLFKVKSSTHIEKKLFGYKESSEISFMASNQEELSAYLSMLAKLSEKDGISLRLRGRHQVNQGSVQYFSIPGRLVANGYSANEVWTKVVIVCEMTF